MTDHPGPDLVAEILSHNERVLEHNEQVLALQGQYQQTVAELARHNQELSLALSAAERRAKEAETRVGLMQDAVVDYREIASSAERQAKETEAALDHAVELMNDQTAGAALVMEEVDQLRHTITVLQRTAELQLALVTATADVVEAAREVGACTAGTGQVPCRDGCCIPRLRAKLKTLDQASPREAA